MMRKVHILIPLLLLLCLPVCWMLFDQRVDVFIQYSNKQKWGPAQTSCRNNHIDLVTIRDRSEDVHVFKGWIGLYKKDSVWRWSMGDEIANYTNWADVPKSDEGCVYMEDGKYEWQSDKCDNDHEYICHDKRLILVKEKKTWEDALEHCRTLDPQDATKPVTDNDNNRYDLATLITDDDYSFAKEKAIENGEGVWTGLRFLADQWLWMGGEAVTHMNTNFCPKSQTFCGIMESTNFSLQDCTLERSFLCYTKQIQNTRNAIPLIFLN